MANKNFQYVRHGLVSSVYYKAYHCRARRKIFKLKVFKLLESAIPSFVFAKRAVLLIFEVVFTEGVL